MSSILFQVLVTYFSSRKLFWLLFENVLVFCRYYIVLKFWLAIIEEPKILLMSLCFKMELSKFFHNFPDFSFLLDGQKCHLSKDYFEFFNPVGWNNFVQFVVFSFGFPNFVKIKAHKGIDVVTTQIMACKTQNCTSNVSLPILYIQSQHIIKYPQYKTSTFFLLKSQTFYRERINTIEACIIYVGV